jgi:dihydroorotase
MRRAGCIQSHLVGVGRRGPAPEPLPTTVHAASAGVIYDTVIRGGSAFEADGYPPGTVLDLAIKDGLIAAIERPGVIAVGAGAEEVDATDMVVCPGLIDAHAHVFTGMTPLGVDPDEWCLGRGCTTVVDAGSAGATTVEGFIRYIDGQSLTRCLSFVNIGMHGLAGTGGACESSCNDAQCHRRVSRPGFSLV